MKSIVVSFALVELSIVSWCAVYPLLTLLPHLGTLISWIDIYSVAASNLDVWLLSVARNALIYLIVSGAPTVLSDRCPTKQEAPHKKLRQWVGLFCSLFEVIMMTKAAAVAVAAPEQLWPDPTMLPPPPSGGGGDGPTLSGPHFVGLVYMYTSICAAVVGSVCQSMLAKSALHQAEDQYEDSRTKTGSLTAPLLGKHVTGHDSGCKTIKGGVSGSSDDDTEAVMKGKTGTRKETREGQSKAEDGKKAKAGSVNRKTVWELVRLSYPDLHIVVVAFVFGTAAALAQATIPYYTGLVIDYASIEPDEPRFKRTIIALVVVAALCGVAAGCRGGLFTIAMNRLNVRLRKQLFHSLLMMEVGFFDVTKTGDITSRLAADTTTVSDQMEIGFFDVTKTGDITSRLAADTTTVSTQVSLNLNVMLRSMTQVAMVLAFMFAAQWRLTVVTFILIPAVMAISKIYGKYFASLAKRVQNQLAEVNSTAEEVLSSMTTVKAHAAQDSAEFTYAKQLEKYTVLLVKEAVAYTFYMAANTFLPNAVAAMVLFYGGHLVLSGGMSPGALVSFMLYQQSLSGAFQTLGDVFSSLTAAVGAADKVFELMNRKPEVDSGGSLVPLDFSGSIRFKDVHFYYPARPQHKVLRGVSFYVEPGQVVALVGASGGGKSSIVKLVERFYLPQSGSILLDDRDVGVFDHKWLRRQVALVSQEPVLYARSVRRNIMYGLEAADGVPQPPGQEEVEEAAKQANAHDFIMGFPDGYDTDCGEKGVTLSGGQKQRLAIARALIRKPRILLLDEATSALDTESEAIVQDALDRVMAGRTVLVIAHRLSTVQNANRIIVIGNGVVQEEGTHQDLLSNPHGVYSSLVRRQVAKSPSVQSLNLLSPTHTHATGLGATQRSSSGGGHSSKAPSGLPRVPANTDEGVTTGTEITHRSEFTPQTIQQQEPPHVSHAAGRSAE